MAARVNGSALSRYELDRAVDRTLGGGGFPVDQSVRHKVLESMVVNRAIAQSAEAGLTGEDRALLDAEMSAHRDQFLARIYLAKHAPPMPIDDAAVQAWYDAHQAVFGGGAERRYELVSADKTLTDDAREKVLEALKDLSTQPDWPAGASRWKQKGLPVAYSRGSSVNGLLHPRIAEFIQSEPVNGPGKVLLVETRPYLLRVIAEIPKPARPLAEVRQQIIAAIAAQQLRQSLDRVTPDILAKARIEYLDGGR